MASAVFDSSAILAMINGERGGELVATMIKGGLVSAINYAEVVTKLVDRGVALADIRRSLARLEFVIVVFDQEMAERAGELRQQTRRLGLSLADRACLALADREQIPAFTGDRAWIGAVPGIEVRAIR
jgi:ribonuclease VapC